MYKRKRGGFGEDASISYAGLFLAFFTVVASCPNLSTFTFEDKVTIFWRKLRHSSPFILLVVRDLTHFCASSVGCLPHRKPGRRHEKANRPTGPLAGMNEAGCVLSGLGLKGEGVHLHLLEHGKETVAAGGGQVLGKTDLGDEVEVGCEDVGGCLMV